MLTKQTKVTTVADLEKRESRLPKAWQEAAGILRGKTKLDPLKYQRAIRQEWEKRVQRQSRLTQTNGR